jgi:plastocyanin
MGGMRKRLVLFAVLGAAGVFAWPANAATTNATIQGSAYHPDPLTINAGDSVTWTNKDVATHTVTDKGPGKTFDSGNIAFNGTFTHVFTTAGTFTYYCTIHGFQGTLVVKSAGATTTAKPAPTTTKAPATTTTKPTTTTTRASTTTAAATASTIGNATADASSTTSTVPSGTAATLPTHHDSSAGPLLAAVVVVLAAIAALGVYLFRRRRAGY